MHSPSKRYLTLIYFEINLMECSLEESFDIINGYYLIFKLCETDLEIVDTHKYFSTLLKYSCLDILCLKTLVF